MLYYSLQNNLYEDTRINSMQLRHRREVLHKQKLELKEKEKLDIFNEMKK